MKEPRTMRTHTRKLKRLGRYLLSAESRGVGGVVPNHAPYMHNFMIARDDSWAVHLEVSTLRTWDGHASLHVRVSLNPSLARRKALHEAYLERH